MASKFSAQDNIFIGLIVAISELNYGKAENLIKLLKKRDAKSGTRTLSWEDGNFLLCKALQGPVTFFADLLLDYGVGHVNRSCYRPCNTALHLALRYNNNLQLIEKLLIRGADINAKNSEGKSALYLAAEANDYQVVEMMLKYNNTQLNSKAQRNWVVIDLIASKGNEKIFNLLVSCGAHANLKYLDGKSLLHVAVEKGYFIPIKQIIEEKKYDIKDPNNKEVLTVAIKNFKEKERSGNDNYELILTKLFNAKFPCKQEIIYDAEFIHKVAKKGLTTIFDVLLNMGTDPNIEEQGCPLLVTAIDAANDDIVKRLLQERAVDINRKNNNGKNALDYAIRNLHSSNRTLYWGYEANCPKKFLDNEKTCCHNNWFRIIKILINLGSDVGSTDPNTMMTPLHYAAPKVWYPGLFHYIKELCKLLINAGADLLACDRDGNTPLQYAITLDRAEMVEFLLSYIIVHNYCINNQEQTLLHSAAVIKTSKILEILLKRKEFKDLDVKDINGNTPLILAVKKGQMEAVNILLQNGANINASNEERMTSLHYATENEVASAKFGIREGILEVLLENHANPNCLDIYERTPLFIAAKANDNDSVKLLLKYKADINLRCGMFGKTVLHYLAESRDKMTFDILKYGADINSRTNYKETALDCLMQSMVTYCNSNYSVNDREPHFRENAYVLIKHILQRHAINYFVCEENLLAIDEYEKKYVWVEDHTYSESGEEIKVIKIDKLRKMCEREVELMKQYTFRNTNVNVYQILMKCPHRLAKYLLKNDNVINQLQVPVFFDIFPMYRDMLRLRIEECLARKILLDQDVDYSFYNIFPYLPFVCIEEILGFLNNQDLKSLISVCQLMMDCQDSVCNISIPQDELERGHKAKKLKV